MESWEEYDDEAPKKKQPVKASWDDEEEDGPVKESWEDEFEDGPKKAAPKESWEDEFDEKPKEASKAKPPQPAAADKTPAEPKKQTLKDKIAQKEAATKKKTVKKIDDDDDGEDSLARKMREQKMVEDADIENAKDMFAGVKTAPKASSSLLDSTPRTKAEFEEYANALGEKVLAFEKSKEYVGFLEAFLRKAVTNTKTDDVRKLSSTLSVIANEKQRAVNAKDKGKKQPPAAKKNLGTIKVERDEIEEYEEEDYGAADQDDYDSFM